MTGNRSKRTVLYLTPVAVERLEVVAAERSEAAGVEVTPEGAARALLYAGLKLAPDGARDLPPSPTHPTMIGLQAFFREMGAKSPKLREMVGKHLLGAGMDPEEADRFLDRLEVK